MGLAIDGNVVHGIAKGGQAFLAMQANKDGSINIGGQNYLSTNSMKIKKISKWGLNFTNFGESPTGTIDITSDLSNYAGYLAICVIVPSSDSSGPDFTISQPFIIPTAPTTENPSFLDSKIASLYHMSLSRTTDNKFILSDNPNATYVEYYFFILSNAAS